MNYLDHLSFLKSLKPEEEAKLKNDLIQLTPEKVWPDGMPASLDPKLVLVGVSPGNAPNYETEELRKESSDYCYSEPRAIKTENSHFYYPDARDYWIKLRYLSHSFFKRFHPEITEIQALSLTSHVNLGTGSAGSATIKDVEKDYVKWVSDLLNETHSPDLVVLFGLNGILKDDDISKWWNESGLRVDWKKPTNTFGFNGYIQRSYYFREWSVRNAKSHPIRLVIWPNHPSRPPFSDLSIWKQAVSEYLDNYVNESE
ncbi:hypothetical protein [Methylomicrobium sp. Wu6]|uniref:hypothetical protein n=1 Tax=Methylomicrobium sp. Wu6 TaxID=3107928 RepID=UPI002DD68236|nr:hypothetical protein [Methylomicrobium sp. Wu6]MEC4749738.1 hypothetical protein [Methylomicrobium sp. Wu6]